MSGLKQPAPLRSTLEEYDLVIIGSGAGAKFARPGLSQRKANGAHLSRANTRAGPARILRVVPVKTLFTAQA